MNNELKLSLSELYGKPSTSKKTSDTPISKEAIAKRWYEKGVKDGKRELVKEIIEFLKAFE